MATVDISLVPQLKKDQHDTERFAPVQIDMRNVRTTKAGNAVKRPGYTQKWDTGEEFPVVLLIPEVDGYAFTSNGNLYSLGSSVDEIHSGGSTLTIVPQWVKWDEKLIITTGLSPLLVDGDTVTNLGGSPVNGKFIATISSYTVLAGHDPTEFRWSVAGNPENWTILDGSGFANIQKTGTILNMIDYKERLMFFKEREIEIWNFKGAVTTSDAPFARYPGGKIDVGLGAVNSVVKARDDVYWFGDDGEFYAHGNGTRIISGDAKRRLDEMNSPQDMVGVHLRKENLIIWINPTDGMSLVYDYSKDLWLEDNRWDSGWQSLPFSSYMELDRKQYFGSRNLDGLIHEWSEDYKDDNGQPIRAYRNLKHRLSPAGRYTRVDRVLFRREGAVATDSVASPVMEARWRFDKGAWSTWQQSSLGAVGEHDPYATEFRQLGYGRELELEIDESDAVDFLVTNMLVDFQEMRR